MLSFGSAFEFDNWVNYEDNNMKVRITNAFNLGDEIGTAELKSHKSVDEILKVAAGKDVVTMYYDFDFKNKYDNGLGEVEFINMTSGETIEKDYHFVIWETVIEERDNYSTSCNNIYNYTINNISQVCEQTFEGTYLEERKDWVRLDIRDIPKGQVRIGLATDVEVGDTIDGIWTIAGKKIKKHSVWTASLNVDLKSFWKLNGASGVVFDSLFTNNGTNVGATRDVDGIINKSFSFPADSDRVSTTATDFIYDQTAFSISLWWNASSLPVNGKSLFSDLDGGDTSIMFRTKDMFYDIGGSGFKQFNFNEGTVNTGQWYHYVITYEDGTGVKFYINGTLKDSDSTANGTVSSKGAGNDFNIGNDIADLGNAYTGLIDEVGVWNRALGPSEVTQLYNNHLAITFTDQFDSSPSVVLISPANDTQSSSSTIDFNITITDDQAVQNATLLIDGVADQTNSSGANGTYIFTKTLTTGEHNWSILAFDNNSVSNQSETRTINITSGVEVTLNTPLNDTSTDDTSVTFNFTIAPEGVNTTNWTLTVWFDNGTLAHQHINTTINTDQTVDVIHDDTLFFDSSYIWNVEAFGVDGSTVSDLSENRTFEVDATDPQIEFVSPSTESGSFGQDFIVANVSVVDDNFDTTSTFLYNSSGIVSTIFNITTPSLVNFTGLADGTYFLNATANDTFGNTNSTETRTIILDNTKPQIEFVSPTTESGVFDQDFIISNVTVTDASLDTITTFLYNSSGLVISVSNSTIPALVNFTGLANGKYFLNATANDTFGNTNSTETRTIILLNGSLSGIWTSEYQVRIIAFNLTESDFEINNVVVTQEGTNLWKVNTTESDYEVARAQVMKTFFYGTDSTVPRIPLVTGLLKIQSIDNRDNGRRGILAHVEIGSSGGDVTYTGTFENTTSNINCSSWSRLSVSTGDTIAKWQMSPGGVLNSFNGGTGGGISDNLGVDTVVAQQNNPVNSQLFRDANPNSIAMNGDAILFCVGEINWVDSGFDVANNTDFFLNESIPITSPAPNITLNSPENNFQELSDTSIIFNITSTINSGSLSRIDLFIDGVLNETKSISGSDNITIFNKSFTTLGSKNWNVKVCDGDNNCALSPTRDFTISTFKENAITFDSTVFETSESILEINISTNATSVTSGILNYNGVESTADIFTVGADIIINATIQIPTNPGENTFFFSFELDSVATQSTSSNQTVETLEFIFCNATVNIPYINFSFKNETAAQEDLTATMDSTWNIWLGDGTIFKILTLSNATENPNYTICSSASNDTLNTNVSLTYNNAESQQRAFVSTPILTNTTTQQILYLLPTGLGLFGQFQTRDVANNPIALVQGTITRTLSSSIVTVAAGLTDSSGLVIFFLNPDVTYTATFSKSGFVDNIFTFVPTTDIRFVTMGSGVSVNGSNISIGTTYEMTPINSSLNNDTIVEFGFNVTGNDEITFISMNITDGSGISFGDNSTAGTGFITITLNTSKNKTIVGTFIIRTGSENFTVSKIWVIGNEFEGAYSISAQGKLFLLYGFSDFIRLIMILAIIFGVVIFMSRNELADNNESKIAVVVLMIWGFSAIGWLNNPSVVSTTGIALYAKQYGIAILSTAGAVFFFMRRIFV